MQISTNIRNWGDGSQPDVLLECARAAEDGGIATLWVNDRLSTPENRGWRAEDGGRYLDPLMALTFIACATKDIGLGTGVLNLPYRLPFQLVKQVATLQDLSGERFRFGVGVGWYETEFRVLGVPFRERGRRTDQALSLFKDAFAHDEITVNGVEFPALPRPSPPPVYVGGHSHAALKRTIRFGDGWIAAGMLPEQVAAGRARLAELAQQAGRSMPMTIAMKTLPLDDMDAAVALSAEYAEAGVDEVVHADGYGDANAYRRRIERLVERLIPALSP